MKEGGEEEGKRREKERERKRRSEGARRGGMIRERERERVPQTPRKGRPGRTRRHKTGKLTKIKGVGGGEGSVSLTSCEFLFHPLLLASFLILSEATKIFLHPLVNHVQCPEPRSVTTVKIGMLMPVIFLCHLTYFWGV